LFKCIITIPRILEYVSFKQLMKARHPNLLLMLLHKKLLKRPQHQKLLRLRLMLLLLLKMLLRQVHQKMRRPPRVAPKD